MKKIALMLIVTLFSTALVAKEKGAPLLKEGDIFVGGKLAIGAVYGASIGFVGSGEYGIQEGFLNIGDIPSSLGVGAMLGYASYSGGFFGLNWSYTNIVILINGYYHADLLKNPKLDTYFMVGLGYNAGTASLDDPSGTYIKKPTHGGIVLGTGIGGRYYLNPNLSAVAELGVGMGLLRLGVDYKIK
jgi:hypothetical protein